jgi:tetratricopeptide (TPR) repeat protein
MGCGSPRLPASVLLLAVAVTVTTGAIYVQRDVTDVPIDRLVKNLEAEARAKPADAAVRVNLGRLHGMAYALDTGSAPVVTLGTREDVWYGFEPKIVPYSADAKPRSEAATGHLAEAIRWYEAALAIDPSNLTAWLGLGWSLEQQGRKAEAIAAYRRVIEEAWPKEEKIERAALGQNFYTPEAAEYLIPLLDPDKDRAEIEELRGRIAKFGRIPRPITPLAIPLGAAASPHELVDMDAAVLFDGDGSALPRRWTWISRDAAWLVHDPARSGRVESALRLFGNVTFWLFWRNGFEPLAALDDDRDGELQGAELTGLALWHDRDGNAVSSTGEVRPLDAHGILGLRYAHEPGDGFLITAVSRDAVRFSNGRRADLVDVILRPARRVS